MKTAKIIALPRPATEAGSTEPDRITITLNADGTHSARLVGVYAEDPRIALEALGLVVGRIEPVARPAPSFISRAGGQHDAATKICR